MLYEWILSRIVASYYNIYRRYINNWFQGLANEFSLSRNNFFRITCSLLKQQGLTIFVITWRKVEQIETLFIWIFVASRKGHAHDVEHNVVVNKQTFFAHRARAWSLTLISTRISTVPHYGVIIFIPLLDSPQLRTLRYSQGPFSTMRCAATN